MSNTLRDFQSKDSVLNQHRGDYWQYSGKGSEDILLYTEKSSIYETPTKEKFREDSEVLVRWTDGLLYLGNIIKVEDEYGRCAVKFEDGSQYWALYKDIHKGPPTNNEIICTVCDTDSSDPPDEIVICDKCSVGYHQLCHIPKIDSSVLRPEVSWACRKCVFAGAAKKGGAIKKGIKAQTMQIMKQTLPYDLQSLTWDASHRSNLQQTYCYCGGPGEWYMNMIQCLKCKQWFHEACLQCLDEPLLYGDRFFLYICAVCNQGPEFLQRHALRWADIAHLVLFNLTIIHGRKYFDFDTTIMHFLKDKWSQLQVKGQELTRSSLEEKKQKMLEAFQSNRSRFKSGKEVKQRIVQWGLRSRVPPPIPAMVVPETFPVTSDIIDSIKSANKKTKNLTKTESSTPLPLKRNRKPPPLPPFPPNDNFDTSSQSSAMQNHISNDSKVKKDKTRRWQRRRRLKSGSTRKFTQCVSELSDSEDTSSSHGTLNSIIPHPNNFDGPNNPFRCFDRSPSSKSQSSASSTRVTRTASKSTRKLKHRTSKSSKNNKHSFINNLIGSHSLKKDPEPEFHIATQHLDSNVSAAGMKDLNSSMNNYFGAHDRIANGEKFAVVAKRIGPDGRTQYLIEWEGLSS